MARPIQLDKTISELKEKIAGQKLSLKEMKKLLTGPEMPLKRLQSGQSICVPKSEERQWVVVDETIVFPIQRISGRASDLQIAALEPVTTKIPWVFYEKDAHLLNREMWDWSPISGWDWSETEEEASEEREPCVPYFIELPAMTDDKVIGFIVAAGRVLPSFAKEKQQMQQLGLSRIRGTGTTPIIDGQPVAPTAIGMYASDHANKPIIGTLDVESSANPQTKYNFTIFDDMTVGCQCPGWINRRICKHMSNPSSEELWRKLKAEDDKTKKTAKPAHPVVKKADKKQPYLKKS